MKITRKESFKQISEKVDNVEFAKIANHIYSDYVLEMLAKSDRQLVDRIAHTKLSNKAVERLFKAYDSNIITMGDLMHIANYSLVTGVNEKYLNDYFSSIAAGLDTKTASQILVASKFEDWSYNEIYKMVKSGTYDVTDRTFVQLMPEVAEEIDKLGIKLFAYNKDNELYLVKNVARSILAGDAITFSEYELAMKINEMRTLPEWGDFREYLAGDMEDVEQLTVDGLIEAYEDYCKEELNIELSRKVDKNFEAFIDGIREKGVDEAIKCCYEITVKTNIQSFIESEPADITKEQYTAILSSDNPLSEIYYTWISRSNLHTYDDIPQAMELTANEIIECQKRKQESKALTDEPKKKGGAR